MDLIVYGLPLSPFVRKVEVVLGEKGVEYELKPVNIFPAPDWFAEINPAKRIPVLRDKSLGEDATLPDSSAICAYLERKHPEPALYPKDAFAYGRALWYEEYADSELAPQAGMGVFRPLVVSRLMKREPDVERARKTVREALPPMFDYLEREIAGREFYVSERFTIADIAVATQFANLALAGVRPDPKRWPELTAFLERVLGRPSFKRSIEIGQKLVPDVIDLSA